MIADTHCHLHFDAFDPDRAEVIKRARAFGVKYLVNVGTDPDTNEAAFRLAETDPFIFHTAGLHPHSSNQMPEDGWQALEDFIREKKPVAVGEIGLDYFKSEASPDIQKTVFVRMLRLALKYELPVIVHSRNAFRDTMDLLKGEGKGALKGVMHCFSYGEAELAELLGIGFLASFTCNLTFKNAGDLVKVAADAPLDRIMLETDSPYLAPQIYRGKRNEPSCLVNLVQFLAERRGIGEEELADRTTENAVRFFGLPADG
ncbi:MAG TPA: TatD family hydrolase [Candidatus Eisenbacteria bacterium]|jgi:TatD DNase family protein|nr:TatD family hydrolase [Candidatus Eisenbacteria bacterium]